MARAAALATRHGLPHLERDARAALERSGRPRRTWGWRPREAVQGVCNLTAVLRSASAMRKTIKIGLYGLVGLAVIAERIRRFGLDVDGGGGTAEVGSWLTCGFNRRRWGSLVHFDALLLPPGGASRAVSILVPQWVIAPVLRIPCCFELAGHAVATASAKRPRVLSAEHGLHLLVDHAAPRGRSARRRRAALGDHAQARPLARSSAMVERQRDVHQRVTMRLIHSLEK
jgi:hypothetical protein